MKSLSPADMDTKAEACTDFYQYSVGTWLEKNPIPSDRPRWGTFDELRQRTQDNLHKILERLAADKSAKSGSDERKLGDFYGACMDEAAIEAKGLAPARAGAREDRRDQEPRRPPGRDQPPADAGRERPLQLRLGGGPEGLLAGDRGRPPGRPRPSRPRLLHEDRRGVGRAAREVRRARRADAGARRRDAREGRGRREDGHGPGDAARRGVAEQRRPPRSGQDLPPDDARRVLEGQRRTSRGPSYFKDQDVPAVDPAERLAARLLPRRRRAARLRASRGPGRRTCAGSSCRRAAPHVSKKFVDESFAFYGKTLGGIPEIQPRWKRCVTATDDGAGDGARADLRQGVLPARGQEARWTSS